MSSVVRKARYIKASVENNNNKFWYISEFDNATCMVHFGRVGGDGAKKLHNFHSQDRGRTGSSSTNAGRRKANGRGTASWTSSRARPSPRPSARKTWPRSPPSRIHADCKQTQSLIRHLTEANVHNILSATTMQYNVDQGLFSTPCGIVTGQSIASAAVYWTGSAPTWPRGAFASPRISGC